MRPLAKKHWATMAVVAVVALAIVDLGLLREISAVRSISKGVNQPVEAQSRLINLACELSAAEKMIAASQETPLQEQLRLSNKTREYRTRSLALQGYGPIIQRFELTNAQRARFADLILAKRSAALAANDGSELLPHTEDIAGWNERIEAAAAPLDEEIQRLLGEKRARELQAFELTMGWKPVMDKFTRQLVGTASPLTADQSEEIAQAFASSLSSDERAKSRFVMLVSGYPYPRLTPAAIDAARPLLTQSQAAALSGMRDSEQRYIQLAQAIYSPAR